LNKKQKILTAVALVIFGAIIGLHYVTFFQGSPELYDPELGRNIVGDVRMPLFVLAVFYAGLFFLLHDKKN
jgi:hypothetical protein